MKYDFTTILDRKGMDAIAVDNPPGQPKEGFDLIPMWVADMNFPACPTIPEAIIRRTQHTTYGYFAPRQEYYDGKKELADAIAEAEQEIADGENISRQGVRHIIKKGEEQLDFLETKLGLAAHYTELEAAIEKLTRVAENIRANANPEESLNSIFEVITTIQNKGI